MTKDSVIELFSSRTMLWGDEDMKMRPIVCAVLAGVLLAGGQGPTAQAGNGDALAMKQTYEQNPKDVANAHAYAIELARGENFAAALQILKQLYEANPADKAIKNDYIVVLNWSGNNRAALKLFEEEKGAVMPDYVLMSAAGAYYQLQDYPKALAIYQQVGKAGDRKAKLGEAQTYYRLGDAVAGDRIYDALLAENPNDLAVLRSRASMRMQMKDYQGAVVDFDKVLATVAGTPEEPQVRKEVDYDKAIAYIRLNEESKAIVLLKPYIDNGTADVFMQSDYVLALQVYRDYKTAIAEGTRLWPDHGKVPVFGLQALADSYVRSGQPKKAIPIYEEILQRDPDYKGAKMGLAFSHLQTGRLQEGIKIYDELITSDPAAADVALDDAFYFNEKGSYEAGKRLFNLLVKRYPDNALYRQEYASSLFDNNFPRDAYYQYKALAKIKGAEATGLAGMVRSAVEVEDYGKADTTLSTLHAQYAAHVLTQEAAKTYAERRRGGAGVSFIHEDDHKNIKNQNWQINGDQSISGSSYSILAQINRIKISDTGVSPEERTVLHSQAVGLKYKGIRHDIAAWYYRYNNNGSFGGYDYIANFYPSDRLTFGLEASRRPLQDVQALNPGLVPLPEGRVMTQNYTARTRILDGTKNIYDFSFTRSLFSDGNRVNSFAADWTRTLAYDDKREVYRFLYWGRDAYRLQRPELYESPPVRDSYGLGFIKRLKYAKHYWEGTVTLGWGRDRPENTEFEPSFRLEYGYNFSPRHTLILGMEYGLRTDLTNGSRSLGHFGYRRYDANYQFWW